MLVSDSEILQVKKFTYRTPPGVKVAFNRKLIYAGPNRITFVKAWKTYVSGGIN